MKSILIAAAITGIVAALVIVYVSRAFDEEAVGY